MSKTAIVTDSTPYLPTKLVERYKVHILRLRIHWADQTFLDGIDLTPREFYPKLSQASALPSTSQTPIFNFLTVFNQLAEDYQGIIMPLISSGISGTIASALTATAEFDKIPGTV